VTMSYHIVGVANITPDSFSDGGKYDSPDKALAHIEEMITAGATIIDIGAASSRPGAEWVSPDEELSRLDPVLSRYRDYFDTPLSLDTMHASVARWGLEKGVSIINDISGLNHDPDMASVIAKHNATAILMHMNGTPQTMQLNPQYVDVVHDVKESLNQSVVLAKSAGIETIILDPGLGFGKNLAHNLSLQRHIGDILQLGYPVLVGPSRKSWIGQLTGADVSQRLPGTISACVWAFTQGVRYFRIHDVYEVNQALKVIQVISQSL
jgi:dihydropteroate synthase